ncbi:MAG: DNA translocase FtsK 4TM domain-containing protein [Acidimicrobiales bacterium]
MIATRSRSSGRKPAKKKAPARRTAPKPSMGARARTALATHLGRQADDVWGLLLIVLGVLTALGIYADLTGPLGRVVRSGTGAFLGWGRIAVPVILCGLGWVLVRGRSRTEPGRIGIGAAFFVVSGCGLLHLTAGAPRWGSAIDDLTAAGGLLGLAVAEPLRQLVAVWGASLILVTLLLLAVLILTRTPVRVAGQHVTDGGRWAAAGLRVGWQWLVTVGRTSELDQAADRHPSTAPEASASDNDEANKPATQPEAKPAKPKPPTIQLPQEPLPDAEQLTIDLGPAAVPSVWRLPPMQLLHRGATIEIDRRLVEERGRALEEALASHGVETRLVHMTVGPTVTRYELELGPGVKVAKVTALNKDIAYAMAAEDVRILAPIPGRSAIGVEVPNRERQLVLLGDVLTSEDAIKATHPLEVGLGRDIAGRSVMENLASMPHLLIAGATGAGKSSCINSIITSVLVRATPDQVRMILIDPKRVELGQYNGLPHLLTQVVVNPKKAANALQWAVREMERRSDLLGEVGVRDITGYNAAFDRGDLVPEPGSDLVYQRLPFVLCVVDELNDLMMVSARDVEESICRIAQMGRAFGIHLVIATQRPSVDVITGVIKANVPSRMAFAVSSMTDSKVILDQPGAERLVGQGDMLLLTASSTTPRRVQGPWVTEEEVRKIVGHWKRQGQPDYVQGVEGETAVAIPGFTGGDDDDEVLLLQAMELVVRSQLGSTSMLQRKLKVGFARAGRIMDLLEERGVVGPSTGSKAREVMMSVEELDLLMPQAGQDAGQ